jgi:DNA repair exonuclease SbcCD ATPase subunit
MAAQLEHKDLSLDELIHYGVLGQVKWLDSDIAKRLEEYKIELEEEGQEEIKQADEYIDEIDNLEERLNEAESDAENIRHIIALVRDEFERYPQLKNNMPVLAEAIGKLS